MEIIELDKGKATPIQELNEEERQDEEAPSYEEDQPQKGKEKEEDQQSPKGQIVVPS